MDFTPDEDTLAARELAQTIFAELPAGAAAAAEQWDVVWPALVASNLLSIHLPEEIGGSGLGISAIAAVLEEQGRLTAAAPLWPIVTASWALGRFASGDVGERVLPALVDGSALVTLAVEEFGPARPWLPTATATRDADGFAISGIKAVVPFGAVASGMLVSATTDTGPAIFYVDPAASGMSHESAITTDESEVWNVTFSDAPATLIGDADALAQTLDVAALFVAATELGVMQGALRTVADHLTERHQFGRPLATFQSVQHNLADSYIDIDAARVTIWQAAEQIDEGGDAPRPAVAIAQWWAAQSGMDVVHRTEHMHGGTGVDRSHPAHRFYLWARQLSGSLDGAHGALERIGAVLETLPEVIR